MTKKEAEDLIGMINNGQAAESIETIVQIMIIDSSDDKKLQKLEGLYNYLVSNKEGLILYHLRLD